VAWSPRQNKHPRLGADAGEQFRETALSRLLEKCFRRAKFPQWPKPS